MNCTPNPSPREVLQDRIKVVNAFLAAIEMHNKLQAVCYAAYAKGTLTHQEYVTASGAVGITVKELRRVCPSLFLDGKPAGTTGTGAAS